MSQYRNEAGVCVPRVMLPDKEADYYRWAVVACDQYTSQPEYWEKADALVGSAPSTLRLILPEAYLGKPEEEEMIRKIRLSMDEYLSNGVLQERELGFVLVKRTVGGKTRTGLVLALDLEEYDYSKGSRTLIRATEGTIVERIPPRLRIREGAPVELPHILVLIDDPDRTVIEPLAEQEEEFEVLYDTDLMLDGGHITGRMVSDPEKIRQVLDALEVLKDPDAFHAQYGPDASPLLFAMGDGNHSFATAKANWEKVKEGLSEAEKADHPARYALVEIENVHDEGIEFEPIHRVVFGMHGEDAAVRILRKLMTLNGGAEAKAGEYEASGGTEKHVIPYFTDGKKGAFIIYQPTAQLAVGTLQNAIDAVRNEDPSVEVDYIHGADVVRELSDKGNAIGFLLPAMEKHELFPTVIYDGALPRKTFSMGEANEKRYYMECRRIGR